MRLIIAVYRLLYTHVCGSQPACSLQTTYVARHSSNTVRVDFMQVQVRNDKTTSYIIH